MQRNKVKRLLRNAVDQLVDSFDPAADVVVVARTGAGELCERDGLDGVKRELEELIAQSTKQGD